MANILSIKKDLKERVKSRRKEAKISQSELAGRSGVSFASIRRFETNGEISFSSLLKIAMVLGYENDFNQLFERKNYQSIDEIIGEK
ncbi:MAG: helix-turn-helix domain-containing protein [Rickettsiales bacterium]|jgi:transcriptional regulator with XRE-family HTH domain|nr:helix-turn-helix domain-containing protein [Rickettsiales bacterium]